MNTGRVTVRRPVVLVDDETRVIRLSELRTLYAVAGDLRTLGEALGLSASTLSRALSLGQRGQGAEGREERIREVRELLGDG